MGQPMTGREVLIAADAEDASRRLRAELARSGETPEAYLRRRYGDDWLSKLGATIEAATRVLAK
jgi:hypothetical protein